MDYDIIDISFTGTLILLSIVILFVIYKKTRGFSFNPQTIAALGIAVTILGIYTGDRRAVMVGVVCILTGAGTKYINR
ncbi:MAG: hypothetical protein ACOCWO_01600 [Candidatus Muiribacteriaceae bacterium]